MFVTKIFLCQNLQQFRDEGTLNYLILLSATEELLPTGLGCCLDVFVI